LDGGLVPSVNRKSEIANHKSAFTIVELMVVVLIIALLISLLIPAIGKVRERARATETANFISQLQAAIESYQQEYRAYPGPIADDMLRNNGLALTFSSSNPAGYDNTFKNGRVTAPENLVLGLLGGLVFNTTSGFIEYDPTLVGQGPRGLNPAQPKSHPAFIDNTRLSWRDSSTGKTGHYLDGAGFADDSSIPEFVDTFLTPMPVLYLRAKRGVQPITTGLTATNNSVVTFSTALPRVGTYDLSAIVAYTGAYTGNEASPALDGNVPPSNDAHSIGEGKKASGYMAGGSSVSMPNSNFYHGLRTVDPTATLANTGNTYKYPYDAYPYLQDPNSPNSARNKDSYILISAGIDRIYGTSDDVVSFGSVQ